MPDTVVTIIATAIILGWLLIAICAAVVVGHLFAGPPEVMLADTFAEHEDEPTEVDGPTSRPYIRNEGGPISTGVVWERDPDEVILVQPSSTDPKDYCRACVVAYSERDYKAICKSCSPRMGVRP